eukprot:3930760-Karenia_brevis.AAC.1
MWSWRSGTNQRRELVHTRMDNILERGVGLPAVLVDADAELFRRLELVATTETANSKAPCKYLGLYVGAQCYEPNPSKWTSRFYPAQLGKTKAEVYFEWSFVSRNSGNTPHRVAAT